MFPGCVRGARGPHAAFGPPACGKPTARYYFYRLLPQAWGWRSLGAEGGTDLGIFLPTVTFSQLLFALGFIYEPPRVVKVCRHWRGPKGSAAPPDGFCRRTVLFGGALYPGRHLLLGRLVVPMRRKQALWEVLDGELTPSQAASPRALPASGLTPLGSRP